MVDVTCMLSVCYVGSLNFTIDFTRFSPGGHILVITATSTSGATSSFDTGFTVPEPLGKCIQLSLVYLFRNVLF